MTAAWMAERFPLEKEDSFAEPGQCAEESSFTCPMHLPWAAWASLILGTCRFIFWYFSWPMACAGYAPARCPAWHCWGASLL